MKRDDKAQAFEAVCRKLDKPIDKDVVLNDIDSLMKMEDLANQRQKDLDNKSAEVTTLGVKIQQLEEDKKNIETDLDTSQRRIVDLGINIRDLTTQIDDLKKQKPLKEYSVKDLIVQIFKKIVLR